jgi:hypothetical protein
MNLTELTKKSKDDLEVLTKVASDYAYLIGLVKTSKVAEQPAEWLRENILAYMVFIYGKLMTSIRVLHGYQIDDIIPHINSKSYDQFTCFDITRSVYESFLQSSWILKEFRTEEQRHFLLLWWTIRAYSERVSLAKAKHAEDEAENAKLEITKLCGILNSRYQKELEGYKQKFNGKDANGLPKWPKPGQLYRIAGVSKFHHDYIYKFHSLYAHSEPFAMTQLKHFLNNPIDINLHIEFTAPYLIFFSVAALDNYRILFPEADTAVKEDQQLQHLIELSTAYLGKENLIS